MGFLRGGKQQKKKKERKRGVRKSKSVRFVDSEGRAAPRRRGRLPAAKTPSEDFKRPEQPDVDATSFPGEGNPNSSSGHGEAEAEAEDSEGEENWECSACHFRRNLLSDTEMLRMCEAGGKATGPRGTELHGRAGQGARQGHEETRVLFFAGLLQMVLGK